MVVDAFLLVGFLAFLAVVLLISVRRVPYFISPICFLPLIRVPKERLWSPGAPNFFRGARSPKPFST